MSISHNAFAMQSGHYMYFRILININLYLCGHSLLINLLQHEKTNKYIIQTKKCRLNTIRRVSLRVSFKMVYKIFRRKLFLVTLIQRGFQYRLYLLLVGPPFKPSVKKGHKEVEFAPVNLHLQRMWVSNETDKTGKGSFT